MNVFDSGLLLLTALLISCLINQFVPKISTPLIQVILGIVIALGPIAFDLHFEPELFMLVFIAPLLFNDGKATDKKALWNLKAPILSLALGLVLATVLCIGYFVNWLIPSIPLAAAFALAAALAPTDAVSVSSMSDSVSLTSYESHLLEGESLINDASGIVSFQFAVAAMVTGTFSLASAGATFLVTFFGGIALGLALAGLKYLLVRWLRSTGVESTTFHVILEILTPFVVYLLAERFGVSGILAVVAAGIAQSFGYRKISPGAAKLNIVSTSVWSVLIFALNGLVFLLLGTQIPGTLRGIWESSRIGNLELIGYVLAISAALLLLRFIWALVMPSKRDSQGRSRRGEDKRPEKVPLSEQVHEAVLISLAGVKGSITLATVLTLPFLLKSGDSFPERNLIIFLAASTIVVSLLVANFILPLVSPKKKERPLHESEIGAILEILRSVVRELSWQMHSGNEAHRLATEEVISAYSKRIAKVKETNQLESTSRDKLRLQAIDWQIEHAHSLVQSGETSPMAGYIYLYRLNRIREHAIHSNDKFWMLKRFRREFAHRKAIKKRIDATTSEADRKQLRSRGEGPHVEGGANHFTLHDLPVQGYDYVIEKLQAMLSEKDVPAEDVSALISEYTRRRMRAEPKPRDISREERIEDYISEVEAVGLQFERESIQNMLERDKISPETAKMLRDNVALMELDIEDDLGF